MAKILNLEKLIPNDRFILIGGKRIVVPGNISVRQILEIAKVAQAIEKDSSLLSQAFEKLWEILASSNPEITEKDFFDMISMPMLLPLFKFIGNPEEGEEEIKLKPGEPEVFDNRGNVSGAGIAEQVK